MSRLDCVFRPWVPETDHNLILSSWCHQVPEGNNQRPVILALLSRSGAVVACEPRHPDQIFGWLCGEQQGADRILHMVYVRNPWRQQGIGGGLMRQLCPRLGEQTVIHTHRVIGERKHPKAWAALARSWRLKFDPYRVMEIR
jgi:L-amino acid N-acyltransferase YncA